MIQGTHPAVGQSDVSGTALWELHRANVFVSEAKEPRPDDPDADNWRGASRMRNGTLRELVGPRRFDRLAQYLGIDKHHLVQLKPWVAFVVLRDEVAEQRNLEMLLRDEADRRGLPLEELDSWKEHVGYLDRAITPAVLAAAIDDHGHASCHTAYQVAAFRAGNAAAFAHDGVQAATPAAVRTARWMKRFGVLLDGGFHVFAAIGIGNLVGPYGVLQRLSALGYRVERI